MMLTPAPPSSRRMRRRFGCRPFVLLLIFLQSAGAAAHSHFHSSHSLSPSPWPSPAAPVPTSASSSSNGSSSSSLDPSQSRALSSLGLSPVGPDPCSDPSISCDSSSSPFHRIVFLRLQYCAFNHKLPSSAWNILSPSLTSLSFLDCPAPPPHLPPNLSHSLLSLQVVSSLGRAVENAMAPGLPASWLSAFHGLSHLTVEEVEVSAAAAAAATVSAVIANMSALQTLVLSSANISGSLPSSWPSPHLQSLQISGNDLRGPIPPSIARLRLLSSLDLSSSNLSGSLPPHLSNLSSLQRLDLSHNLLSGPLPSRFHRCASLQYLDLSSNHLSGPVPEFLARMPSLRYVDLSHNRFFGILPFGDAFLRSLNTFKAAGNAALCFNSSIASAVYLPGLQPCDASGRPLQMSEGSGPAPAPSPDAVMQEGPAPSGRRGPSKTVLVVAIALASIVALIVVLVVISRCCSGKRA